MEEKKNSLNAGKDNPASKNPEKQPELTVPSELPRELETKQQESEKQFQVDPDYFTPQGNPKKLWKPLAEKKKKFLEEGREAEYYAQNELLRVNPVARIIEKAVDEYLAEEERLKPENRYEDTWIIERDKDGKTKSFRSNGSTNVLVIETDGTEKFYKKPDGVSRADFFAYYAGIPIYKEDMDANRRSERVLRNAGFYSDGTKWYNTKDKKNEPTKKFDIYGNPFYENQPPQNKFEKQIYDKNQNLYKKLGRKITSLNGNVADLDNGTGKVLVDVPYKNQLKNRTKAQEGEVEVSGKNMCQLTSLAMVLESKGFCSGDKNRRLPDVLYDIAEKEGWGGTKIWNDTNLMYDSLHKKVFKDLNTAKGENIPRSEFVQGIKAQIDKGNPVIMSIEYTLPDKRAGGHVVAVVGYTDKGFIVHDPYGNLNKGENGGYVNKKGAVDFDGSFVEYDYDKWRIGEKWYRTIEEQ